MQVAEHRRTLFEISDDLQALDDLLFESGGDVTDPEVESALDNWFQTLGNERDNKLDSYAGLITELTARAKARKEEADRLATRAKVDENAAKGLKDRLVYFFAQHDMKTVETARYRLTRCNAGGKQPVNVKVPDDELPERFRRVKTYVSADKDAILEAIESGEDISEYAELAPRSQYMRIS